MADRSLIEWTNATWNPTTGCDRTSLGCDHCYALALAKRLKAMGVPKYERDGNPRTSGPGFGLTLHTGALEVPLGWKAPRRIFVNSMSDLFHREVPLAYIRRVFDVIERTPQHEYQLLTKRSKRLQTLHSRLPWPDNLWIGVSVESPRYSFRIDHLREVEASAVRFISMEPLLAPMPNIDLVGIDWVIVGGESGASARPLDGSWVREIRDQCINAAVPLFFKQWGGRTAKANGRDLDGRTWDEYPVSRSDADRGRLSDVAGRRLAV